MKINCSINLLKLECRLPLINNMLGIIPIICNISTLPTIFIIIISAKRRPLLDICRFPPSLATLTSSVFSSLSEFLRSFCFLCGAPFNIFLYVAICSASKGACPQCPRLLTFGVFSGYVGYLGSPKDRSSSDSIT